MQKEGSQQTRTKAKLIEETLRAVLLGLGRIVALYHLLILFTPESQTYSVPLFLKRQCDYTLGSVALSLCTTAHPLHTRFANIFGASVPETTMRPNPRCDIHRGIDFSGDPIGGECRRGG